MLVRACALSSAAPIYQPRPLLHVCAYLCAYAPAPSWVVSCPDPTPRERVGSGDETILLVGQLRPTTNVSMRACLLQIARSRYKLNQSLTRSAQLVTNSVAVRNEQLHYHLRGNGSHTILCIPGALGTALTDFLPQLEHFGRQESGFTIVGVDPLGYGASRPPEREFLVKPDHFLKRDALDGHALMQALSFRKFSVLGWSDGGVSAIILAALFPESVKKLVIWGSNAYVTKDDIVLFEKTRDVSNWSQRMRQTMEDIYGDSFQSLWCRWIDAMKEIYRTRQDGDLCLQEVKRVQCPTLIVHGAKDAMCPQFHAEYLKENIDGSEMIVMMEGKHNLHLRYSQEFNKVIEEFLIT